MIKAVKLAFMVVLAIVAGCQAPGKSANVMAKRVGGGVAGVAATVVAVPEFAADADFDGDVDLDDYAIAQQEFTGPDDLATVLTLDESWDGSQLTVAIEAAIASGRYASGGQFVLAYPEALAYDHVEPGAFTTLWTTVEHVDSDGGPFVEVVMGGMLDRVEGAATLAHVVFALRDGVGQPPSGSVHWTTWTHCGGVVTTDCGSPNLNCENQVIGVCDGQVQQCVNTRLTSFGRVVCPLQLK